MKKDTTIYDFVKSLSVGQRKKVKKLLHYDEILNKYEVIIIFWDNTNILRALAEYVGGVKHGKSMGWDEDGNKSFDEEWKNGDKHGKCMYWDEDGDGEEREEMWVDGELKLLKETISV